MTGISATEPQYDRLRVVSGESDPVASATMADTMPARGKNRFVVTVATVERHSVENMPDISRTIADFTRSH